MDHGLFKPKNVDEALESVIGSCNGFDRKTRDEHETPAFARAILRAAGPTYAGMVLLDYGCGFGRLAKEILAQDPKVSIIGVDASEEELKLAVQHVSNSRFSTLKPWELTQKVDFVYSVYVLQHIPALDLREALMRIFDRLKDDGKFVFCSSLYRMAASKDGFWDDREKNLVDLESELSRFFYKREDLFTSEDFKDNVVKVMVTGEGGQLAHPAWTFKKKPLSGHLYNARPDAEPAYDGPRRLTLRNRLSPGDILVMSAAIRALHKAHPGQFLTGVDTPCNAIFENSPYVTPMDSKAEVIDMQYPEIHLSGMSGRHFSDGHRMYLEEKLGIKIPTAGLAPDLFLSQDETLWPSPTLSQGWDGPYWVLNAGSKGDYPLKQYHRYQEVVTLLKDRVKFVQVGAQEHNHPALEGVIDLRGKTTHRELYRLIHQAEGVLTCVSYHMHIAAALKKPCVVVAGGREGARWEYYPSHRYLAVNGALDCCTYDGCWKSKPEECLNWLEEVKAPKCLEIIKPEDIVRAINIYYEGGILERKEVLK